MLDNVGDGLPEGYEDCLSIAKAALTLITIGVDDHTGKLISILGAMCEMALKHIDDADERDDTTIEFLQMLADHMGLGTRREDRCR